MESTKIQLESGAARKEKEDGEVPPPAREKLEAGDGKMEGAEAEPRVEGGQKDDGKEEKDEVGEVKPPATGVTVAGTGREEGAAAVPREIGGSMEDGKDEKDEVGEVPPPAIGGDKEEAKEGGAEVGGMGAKDGEEYGSQTEEEAAEVAAAVESLVDGVVRMEEEEEEALLATGTAYDVSGYPLAIDYGSFVPRGLR